MIHGASPFVLSNDDMTLPESPMTIEIGSLQLTLVSAASRQIDAAIDALKAGDFDTALTLAGAAEGMIPSTGTDVFSKLKDSPKALERLSKKDWINLINQKFYWLKHGGEAAMEIECWAAAFMIARASSKIEKRTPKMVEFKIWLQTNIDRV
jgi:hypothetical protein